MPLVEENSAFVANKVQKKDAFGKVRLGAGCIGMASLKPNLERQKMSTRKFNDGFTARSLRHCVAAILLIFAGQSALANELSYSFVEVDYIDGDILGESADGFGIAGSFELGDVFFLGGSYQDSEIDDFGTDVELLRLGVGLHGAISKNLDWVASLDYANIDVSATTGSMSVSDDESGYILDLGIRGLVGDAAEYSFAIIQSDVSESDTGFRVGGRYHFGDSNVSAGLDYVQYGSDWDQLELGVRYQFD